MLVGKSSFSQPIRGVSAPVASSQGRFNGIKLRSTQLKAVATADDAVWQDIEAQAGVDILKGYSAGLPGAPGAAASSKEGTILPTEKDVPTAQRVILYRDTNGWCPFCSKVWIALEEKGIPFDTILIDLFNKPEWYPEVAANGQTPAVRLDGEHLCESYDILLALEEAFPDHTPLLPRDPQAAAAVKEFCEWVNSTRSPIAKAFAKDFDSAAQAEIIEFLDKVEATKSQLFEELSGPHLFGEFSLADVMVAPFLPLAMQTGQESINLSRHPHVRKAMEALMEKDSYRAAATDLWTLERIQRFFLQDGTKPVVDITTVNERDMQDRREAAAKLTVRREAIVRKLALDSGVIHRPGSMYGACYSDVNGRMMNPYEGRINAVVEAAIQRVCMMLLTGDPGKSSVDSEATAIQAASIACLRNLGCSPRDMSTGALSQLRDACDVVLQRLYEYPTPKRALAMQEAVRARRQAAEADEAEAAESKAATA